MQLPEFKRDVTVTITKRLKEKRNFIQVISGPRQVGKTTVIQQILEDMDASYHYATADLPAPPPIEWITQQWDLGRRKAKDGKPAILVLDEVQKISNWSEEVRKSNVYIGILGQKYGGSGKGALSPTEAEFREAKAKHKEILIYIKDDGSDDRTRDIGVQKLIRKIRDIGNDQTMQSARGARAGVCFNKEC